MKAGMEREEERKKKKRKEERGSRDERHQTLLPAIAQMQLMLILKLTDLFAADNGYFL